MDESLTGSTCCLIWDVKMPSASSYFRFYGMGTSNRVGALAARNLARRDTARMPTTICHVTNSNSTSSVIISLVIAPIRVSLDSFYVIWL